MKKQSNFIAYIFLFLTVTFWAGNFVVGKFASLYEVPPFSLNFYRWFFAWLILAPFTLPEIIKKKDYIINNYKLFIVLGVTSITIFNSIVYYSLNFTQVISGVLMISTIPVMIMFFSSIMKIEKTNLFQIIGVIFSFVGVIIIITKANFEILKNLNFNKGDITMVVAMFSWALYSTLLKKQKYEISQLSLLQVVMSFGLAFLIPIYFIEYQLGFRITLDKPFILILSYVVLLPGLASFILWIKGISMIGANRSGVFLHLMPILSAIMAMIIFNEKFMFYHMLGACFIITGILLSNKKVKNA
ncbi:DMT family transporter [Candidatus Pelagibacter sp.]|jgi:drug/metabolite transporter (DMT)-like permease|nr:DMT family transporter [Candidatus Pelagibacter sp.]MDA9957166.1 DMT family transporter [Candidatus Pelagibacter sp.]MDB9922759.1 DMT family transporter [Candidatus Pelagibacter sp.]MDC0908338.1 DMT family transporter [Candidatus Pelagibacter sp.]